MTAYIKLPIETPEINIALAAIESRLEEFIHLGETIMAKLEDVVAAVAAEKTVVDSAIALLSSLSEKIAALKPDQAAIDQLAQDVVAQRDALAAAVEANTQS